MDAGGQAYVFVQSGCVLPSSTQLVFYFLALQYAHAGERTCGLEEHSTGMDRVNCKRLGHLQVLQVELTSSASVTCKCVSELQVS